MDRNAATQIYSRITQDDPAAQRDLSVGCRRDTDPAVRLALTPSGAGNEAAVTTTAIPPLGGGANLHGGGATHAATIADNPSWSPVQARTRGRRAPLLLG